MTLVVKFALLAVCACNRNCNNFFLYKEFETSWQNATSAPMMALLERRVAGTSRLFRSAVDRWHRVVHCSTSDARSEMDREGNKRKLRQESYTMLIGRTKRSAYPFRWNIVRLCINNVANWKIKSIYAVLQQNTVLHATHKTQHFLFMMLGVHQRVFCFILLHLSTSSMWRGLIRT